MPKVKRDLSAGSVWINPHAQGAVAVTESRLHEGISVVEKGDQVQFSRQGPFGVTSWTKKLDEVNEVERTAIEKSRAAKQKQ